MNGHKIQIRLACLFIAAMFAAASIIGAEAKETVLNKESAPGTIKVTIGGPDALLNGIFYVKHGISLGKVLSASEAKDSFARRVEVYDSQNQKKSYRFRKLSEKELEAIVLHDGDKVYFPCTFF